MDKSPTAGAVKAPEIGRINRLKVPAMFLQDTASVAGPSKLSTTGSLGVKKSNELFKPDQMKQRTEPEPYTKNTTSPGLKPVTPGNHSKQPSDNKVSGTASPTTTGYSALISANKTSPSFQSHNSNVQRSGLNIDRSAREQDDASNSGGSSSSSSPIVLHQKTSGKKFKKINLGSAASKLPACRRPYPAIGVDLSTIRQQYHKAVSGFKEEVKVSAQDDNDGGIYVDTAPDVPPRRPYSTPKSGHISVIPDISAEEEAGLMCQDEFTSLAVPDDDLYVDAITERKVTQVNIGQLTADKKTYDKKRQQKEKAVAKKKEEKDRKEKEAVTYHTTPQEEVEESVYDDVDMK